MRDQNDATTKKLRIRMGLIIVLSLLLCVVSFALGMSASEKIKNNLFYTGEVKISLSRISSINVIDNVEPGMTIVRNFQVTNESPIDVYYKAYFENVSGTLKDVIQVKAVEGGTGTVLFEGTAKDFIKSNSAVVPGAALAAGTSREITLYFLFPSEAGSEYGNEELVFDLTVLAVQTKNNPDKEFE